MGTGTRQIPGNRRELAGIGLVELQRRSSVPQLLLSSVGSCSLSKPVRRKKGTGTLIFSNRSACPGAPEDGEGRPPKKSQTHAPDSLLRVLCGSYFFCPPPAGLLSIGVARQIDAASTPGWIIALQGVTALPDSARSGDGEGTSPTKKGRARFRY